MPSLQRASRNQLLFPEFEFLEKKKKKKILELEKKFGEKKMKMTTRKRIRIRRWGAEK